MHVKFIGSTGSVIMLPVYDVLKCCPVSIDSSLGFGHYKKLSNAQQSALMLNKIISWHLTVSVMHCTKTKETQASFLQKDDSDSREKTATSVNIINIRCSLKHSTTLSVEEHETVK